ncbi:MAG TPA: efflux RND transporter periplasmic adaptor subunit [Candidatus Binataceae bacterium]|jgi:RND family efflux transporter MFP subunit|nr:efflux RND transporter periplasmic adaptor subunit [Candidatus Binataceae bacterium]
MSSQVDRHQKISALFVVGAVISVIVIVCASAGLVIAHQMRIGSQSEALAHRLAKGPRVLVTQLEPGAPMRTLELPASIHGFIETPVYAKVAGYMKSIRVDKGDHIKAGEIIAVIESPETDKAVADAWANYWLQAVTDKRNQQLVRQQVIPQQTADDSHSAMLQAWAAYQQQRALQGYEIVRAPFDAIVTARYVDPGTMIPQSTSATGTNYPIVSLAELSPLRVYAYAPQSLSTSIRDGDPATITVAEYRGRNFTGAITRHPEALDQNTRTMLIEVDLPNTDRSLYPGMYARMKFTTHTSGATLYAPDDALIFRDNKVYLPIVRDNRLNLVAVDLGHDNGYTVEVDGDGLKAGELVAMNVGEAARDGEAVQPVPQAQE